MKFPFLSRVGYRRAAILSAILLAWGAQPALAVDTVTITQVGPAANDAYVEQTGTTNSLVTVRQEGENHVGSAAADKPGALQRDSSDARIAIDQKGMSNADAAQERVTKGDISIQQDGLGMKIDVAQSGGLRVQATVVQLGAHQGGGVYQRDAEDASAELKQDGDGNNGVIEQTNSGRAEAGIYQTFGYGTASISQLNTADSKATISQGGSSNFGDIKQANGDHLVAALTQNGVNHVASITQTGSFNSSTANQAGNWNEARILQAGTNNTATVNQTGTGTNTASRNIAQIDQAGTGMVGTITQSGSMQLAAMKQR